MHDDDDAPDLYLDPNCGDGTCKPGCVCFSRPAAGVLSVEQRERERRARIEWLGGYEAEELRRTDARR